jgi:predicted transcriptional regulator
MLKNNLKIEAIKLREKGMSYEKISSLLNIAKSTSYFWLKNIPLNPSAKRRLAASQIKGREKGNNTQKQKREVRDLLISKNVSKALGDLKLNLITKKLLCSFLYWGEGEKSENKIAFTNSDPLLIQTFLKLFRNCFSLNETKFSAFLHLHDYHNREELINFWAKITSIHKSKIRVYNKKSLHVSKKMDYKGCISLRYNDVKISKEIKFLYTNFLLAI